MQSRRRAAGAHTIADTGELSLQVPELEAHAAGLVKNLFLKVRGHS